MTDSTSMTVAQAALAAAKDLLGEINRRAVELRAIRALLEPVAEQYAKVFDVYDIIAEINGLAARLDEITALGPRAADIALLADMQFEIHAVALNGANVASVAENMAAILATEGHATTAAASSASAADNAGAVGFSFTLYKATGIGTGVEYVERKALAAQQYTSLYIEAVAGAAGATADVSILINGAIASGPHTVSVGQPAIDLTGLALSLPLSGTLDVATSYVSGTITDLFIRGRGELT